MNQNLQNIFNIIQQSEKLDSEQKESLLRAIKDADKELMITAFKLERTEKVKKTTAILLEETIEELEQKRKAVEEQNRELEIETALEKVRSSALSMKQPEDMVDVCRIISDQLTLLGVKDIRNVQTAIINEKKGTYINYQYFTAYQKSVVEETEYDKHPKVFAMVLEMKRSVDAFFSGSMVDEELNIFREYRKQDGQFPDPMLDEATEIHYNFYSIGLGGLGLTTYKPLPESALKIFKRFHNVFTLAYRRFIDIQKAKAQAREAQIEAALERVRAKAMAMHSSEDISDTMGIVFTELPKLGISSLRCGVVLLSRDSSEGIFYAAATTEESDSQTVIGKGDMSVHPIFMKQREHWTRNENYFVTLRDEELKSYYAEIFRRSSTPYSPKEHETRTEHGYYFAFSEGMFYVWNEEPYPEESINILNRFRAIIDLTFRRYFDLKKAEAQAREAQIEAALEKVRAHTMGMQKSDEIKEVVKTVMDKMNELNIEMNGGVSLATFIEGSQDLLHWYVNPDHVDGPITMHLPYFDNVLFHDFNNARNSGKEILAVVYSFEQKNEYFDYTFRNSDFKIIPEELKTWILEQPYFGYSVAIQKYSAIFFNDYTGKFFSEEENNVLIRFAKVFDQAYIRFLDLQKAEAQAREAKIELSLERIRARVTAMRESSELLDIVVTMRTEFVALGHEAHYFWYMRWLPDKYEKAMTSGDGTRIGMVMTLPRHIHGDVKRVADWEKSEEPTLVFAMDTDTAVEYVDKMITLGDFQQVDPQAPTLDDIRHIGGLTFIMARTTHGEIGFSLPGKVADPSAESVATLARFASVFDLAYKRFEDLKSSERQRREAQIELALERTRTQSMLMQHSSDLNEISKTFHEQLLGLGIDSEFSFVWLPDEVKQEHLFWATWVNEINGVVQYQSKSINYPLDKTEPGTAKCYRDWESEQPVHETYVPPDQIASFFAEWKELLRGAEKLKPDLFPDGIYYTEAYMKYGCFGIDIRRQLTSEEKEIVRRFSVEFERTYTRFLDLKKAEAQAREGQIQLALEKVRMVALGLNKSEEMLQVAKALYEQLLELGFSNIRNAIIDISNGDGETFTDYDYSHEMSGTITQMSYYDDPTLEGQFKKMADTTDDFFELVLEGKELEDLVNMRLKNGEAQDPRLLNTDLLTYNLFSFGNGAIGVSNFGLLNEEEKSILNRFRNVFTFAYKRYNDLATAEAQAKEAIKQASLDRIRGEIASMRTSEDLNRITPIIWRELKTLDVPFIRCGVFIVDQANEKVQVYLTTPDGKSLGVLNLSFDENELTRNTVEYWKKREVFREHWNKEEFINWTNSMIKIGQIQNAETYQGSTVPPESLDLHFVPFTQGMLYVGDVSSLTDEKLNLVKTLAEAFSIAYARYEDFKNLEEAKNKIELTLHELKSAQAQLVHSEKMASLGELTAGIAHEIKNPLNFVNNFSEMSAELINEIEEELDKNDKQEVLEILKDLKLNLDKINQHGKRADSIVKGMLLHSRGTSGEKTPTDINDLLDQYVNLAYHGMRATNKEFNITIEKDYDKSLEKINVVPQDLSRVFLNIINNACYAAYERKIKTSENNFSPTLKVSTKNLNGKVEIRIGDNGNGIPKNIIEKIFQPFFTTKPTGEGTGLGLSLSYDIVTKVHGGELKVETISAGEVGDEKKGTEFIIQLPTA